MKNRRHNVGSDYYNEDEDEDLDDFIVPDDESEEMNEAQLYLEKFKKKVGAKKEYSDDDVSSDMEASYNEQELEERRTLKIGKRDDRRELARIMEEE